jgi:PadR family transcriptional regulator, regulatory protein AphA
MTTQTPSRAGRKATDPVAAEFAVLGMIAATPEGAIHGYDLSRSLADSALGKIIRIEPGMLYHYLKKLARSDSITTRVEQQQGRPDRQVHALTPEGHAALMSWLAEPVTSTREIRLDFLVKLYLSERLDPDHRFRLIEDQKRVMQNRAKRLQMQVDDPQPLDPDNAFGDMVLRLRLSQTRAALEWLDSIPRSPTS